MSQDQKTHILSGPVRTSESFQRLLVLCAALSVFGGCAYRHYLGIHGPSIKHFPDVHQGVTQDRECLECHDPDGNPTGPPTSHPKFVGCLKCHNDDVGAKEIGALSTAAQVKKFPPVQSGPQTRMDTDKHGLEGLE